MQKPERLSAGHLTFHDDYEYFRYGNIVYRAPKNAFLHESGELSSVRMGAVFYCTWAAWMQSPIMREYSDKYTYSVLAECTGPV